MHKLVDKRFFSLALCLIRFKTIKKQIQPTITITQKTRNTDIRVPTEIEIKAS